jgi:ankyrin repeat protein
MHGGARPAIICHWKTRSPVRASVSQRKSSNCCFGSARIRTRDGARSSREAPVAALLDAGADATARDWLGGSALDYATNEIAFEHISRALFPQIATRDQNALAYLQRRDGRGPPATPLARAIEENLYYLLAPAAAPIAEDDYESHLQYWNEARETRIMERVRVALSIGATLEPWALWWALDRKRHRVARVLLTAGANVNTRQCGPDSYLTGPACRPDNGVTLLTVMASRGDQRGVELLLAFGADPSLRDWAGRVAADLAFTDEIRALVTPR